MAHDRTGLLPMRASMLQASTVRMARTRTSPMKRLSLGALLSCLVAAPAWSADCSASSPAHVVPLIELYTAEGCSDCPPADAWLATMAKDRKGEQAIPLALHVDYWNDLGWLDPFSDKAYTQRQDFRVKLAKKKVRYTPQVMVGKETGVDWRDSGEVRRVLSRVRKQAAGVSLGLDVERNGDTLDVAISAVPQVGRETGKTPDLLWLALYQDGLVSDISDGENKGRTLHHDRVARTLQGPWGLDQAPVDGKLELRLPAGAALDKLGLVLFAESSTTGAGLQALELPLASCGG